MRENEAPVAKTPQGGAAGSWLLAIVAAAALLRGIEAAAKSYWLDELHTLHVSKGGSVADVIDRIRPDFHAPLFFLAVHALDGLHPHALRVLPVILSLLTLLPLLALARAGRMGLRGTILTGTAFAALPFQIQYGAELRPYAGLGLAGAILGWAAFTPAPRPGRRTAIVIFATALGLLSHYVAAAAILGVGAARLVLRPPASLPFKHLLAGGTLGVALFLPWVIYDESWLFEDPGLIARDEDHAGAPDPGLGHLFAEALPALKGDLLSIVPRLLVPSLGGLGGWAGRCAVQGFGLLTGAVALGLITIFLGRHSTGAAEPDRRARGVLSGALLSGVIAFLVVLAACVAVWQRIPLQYFAVAAWTVPLLIGAVADRCPRGVAGTTIVVLMAAGALMAGIAHVSGAPREDLAGAVEVARREVEATGGRATAVLWQPENYAQGTLFRAYAPGFPSVEPDTIGPCAGPQERPIVVVVRSTRAHTRLEDEWRNAGLWGRIPVGRRKIREHRLDARIVVYVLGPA